MIDALNRSPSHPHHRFSTHWGEPWIFGVPDNREQEFFRECGLELRESMSGVRGREQQRYLTRADGTRLGRGRLRPSAAEGEKRNPLAQLATVAKMLAAALPFIWLGLTRRTQWYALAELVVPARNMDGGILSGSRFPKRLLRTRAEPGRVPGAGWGTRRP
jgi:hypothetical protein